MNAALLGVADIGRAIVLVVTGERARSHARAARTCVHKRAQVVVVTPLGVVRAAASRIGVAEVVCTWVLIIAAGWRSWHADATGAGVVDRAQISVLAWRGVQGVFTAEVRGADVIGAGIIIITAHDRDTNAGAGLT